MPFIPHTQSDIAQMLDYLSEKEVTSLFDEVPKSLRRTALPKVDAGLSEMKLTEQFKAQLSQDKAPTSFLGAGAYGHFIPAAVWEIVSRGEFLTAYTPYQAEASQGTLQLLWEFQSMICALTGMPVSNASLYDGATALAEAVLMTCRAKKGKKNHKVAIPAALNPRYLNVLKTITQSLHIEIEILATSASGLTQWPESFEDYTCVVVSQPNFFGALESTDTLTNRAQAAGALVIGVVNPIAMALFKPPGQWGKKGADITCGEGQPLGVPLASGGPYFGFLSCQMALIRQLPGRLVGRTKDVDGKEGFTLTLQAREQHIRRSKATSNICTNQGLLVTAATVYMSLMGRSGLIHVAKQCAKQTLLLKNALSQISGVSVVYAGAHFHEFVVRLEADAELVLKQLSQQGIAGGYLLEKDYPELKNCILVCATELISNEDIEIYARRLQEILIQCPQSTEVSPC